MWVFNTGQDKGDELVWEGMIGFALNWNPS